MAKNIVAADLADECTIQLSYAIGVSKPLSVYVNTNGTNKVDEQKIEKSVQNWTFEGCFETRMIFKNILEVPAILPTQFPYINQWF